MDPSSIKIGIAGFGGAGMAQFQHFNAIRGSTVTAVFDTKDGGCERARQSPGSHRIFRDYDQFLSSGIDAVAVCTPDSTHSKYIVGALNAGKHVVCEKPLADSIQGCRDVLHAQAQSPHLIAAVQHQMRFLPVHKEMKRIIASGEMGKISYIEGYYVHNLTQRAYKYDRWRAEENATPMVYSGCHFVDLLLWLLEDEVEEVMAMSNHIAFPEYPESDCNVVLLRFKSGVLGKIVVAFGAGRPQEHSLRVYGTAKSIENNVLFAKNGTYKVFCRPDHDSMVRCREARSYPWFSLHPKEHTRWWRGFLAPYRVRLVGRMAEFVMGRNVLDKEYGLMGYPFRLYPHRYAVRVSLENFLNAIRGTEPLVCPPMEAAKTVAVCVASVEAYRTGSLIKMADYRV